MTRALFDLDQPKNAAQWIIFVAAMGLTLSHPRGSRMFWQEIRRYLSDRRNEKLAMIKNATLSQALYNAKKRKLIEIATRNGKTIIALTEKGKRRKLEYEFKSLSIPEPQKWDRKWRMAMFDIPLSHSPRRDMLRERLRDMGFKLFQKSIWIHPYPCDEEIDFIAELLGIGKYINLFTATIEEDRELRQIFKL